MTSDASASEVMHPHNVTFYDSVTPDKIPDVAEYAALYADGRFKVQDHHDIRRFKFRRWITTDGSAPHVGITDFEYPNEVFTQPLFLRQWATQRNMLYKRAGIVYSDMSDLHRAQTFLMGEPVLWWIATRNRGQLNPAELSRIIADEFKVILDPATIWGHQYEDVNGDYDVSDLFGSWYH